MKFAVSKPRSYAILGTGALGGFYGARLQRSGLEVHFLLHSDYQVVLQSGLIIDSIEGDFTLAKVNAYQNAQEMPPCDVVIVALKTTQNHLLSQLLPLVLKEQGVVLVLQNGLGMEDEIAALVGDHRVMGGLCFLCANKIGGGHICHLDYGAITLADYAKNYQPAGITERMKQIATDFRNAGILIDLSEDLLHARWQKLVWNIPYNGLSVILNAMTDEMMANPYSRSLVEELMAEVVQGAKSCGRTIEPAFVTRMLTNTAKMKPYKTSMKLDYDLGRTMELSAIFGNPLRFAIQAGVVLPKIAVLYQQLQFLNTRMITTHALK